MARRSRIFAPGLLYHVIAGGNQRQKIFLTERDYQAYPEQVAEYRNRDEYLLQLVRYIHLHPVRSKLV